MKLKAKDYEQVRCLWCGGSRYEMINWEGTGKLFCTQFCVNKWLEAMQKKAQIKKEQFSKTVDIDLLLELIK